MRKPFIILIILMILLAGCNRQSQWNPSVRQLRIILNLDEEVNPFDLIVNESEEDLQIEVLEDTVNVRIPGDYTVKYLITSQDGKQTAEKVFTFTVADKGAPILNIADSITIPRGTPFDITQYASAIDEYDGNVSDSIFYEGSINNYKVGEYTINVYATDRFGNLANKEVKVIVKENSYENFLKLIAGEYTDITYTAGQAPVLMLRDDGTFIFYINGCSVYSGVEGEYVVYDNYIYLTSETTPFSSTAEQNIVVFKLLPDTSNTIVFTSELKTCAPNTGDVFRKRQN